MRIRSVAAVVAAIGIVATACSGVTPANPAGASAVPPASIAAAASGASAPSAGISGLFPVDGHDMFIECRGTGSPTVVFEAGLGSSGETFSALRDEVAKTTRTCVYDRPGLGSSRQRQGNPPVSAGFMANETWKLLQAAHVDGPLVLLGHSYGGALVRLVAHDHPDAVRGVVLEDAVSVHQWEGDWLKNDGDWQDGGSVDRPTSAMELAQVTSLGSIPLVVLTQGQLGGQFEIDWSAFQDELATLSTNSLHLVAADSGHGIHQDAPKLVLEAIAATVDAVRTGGRLPACGPRFEAVGAECVKTTMTDQLAAWDKLRDAVTPAAGSFPAGTYRAELTRDQFQAATGRTAEFNKQTYTWSFAKGRWTLDLSEDGGSPDHLEDVYAATGDTMTIRIPIDWKVPRTPGVNRLRWTADADGTIHFTQIDEERVETGFLEPFVRITAPN
jgi:hypothetical protein